MPLMKVSVTLSLTQEKKDELIAGLGRSIGKIPGKAGFMLIVDLEHEKDMYIGDIKQENMVFIEVHYYSKAQHKAKKELTASAFEEVRKILGTSEDRMFLTIFEHSTWGGFGNFIDEFYMDE